MPWSIVIHSDLQVIETRYSGALSPSELSDAVSATLQAVRDHGTGLLLGDCTTLAGGHSVIDLFDAVRVLLSSGIAFTLKEAVLYPPGPVPPDNVQFWETACVNRGVYVRAFQDRQTAINWLLGSSPNETP